MRSKTITSKPVAPRLHYIIGQPAWEEVGGSVPASANDVGLAKTCRVE